MEWELQAERVASPDVLRGNPLFQQSPSTPSTWPKADRSLLAIIFVVSGSQKGCLVDLELTLILQSLPTDYNRWPISRRWRKLISYDVICVALGLVLS